MLSIFNSNMNLLVSKDKKIEDELDRVYVKSHIIRPLDELDRVSIL